MLLIHNIHYAAHGFIQVQLSAKARSPEYTSKKMVWYAIYMNKLEFKSCIRDVVLFTVVGNAVETCYHFIAVVFYLQQSFLLHCNVAV